MEWIKITVRTNTAGADMVSERLMAEGAKGTMIEDRYDGEQNMEGPQRWDILDPSLLDAMEEDVLVHGFFKGDSTSHERVAALRESVSGLAHMGFDAGPLTLSLEKVQEEDWAENWKKYYKPFRVGERLVIRPPWEAYEQGPEDLVLEIDPGMAFGNGTHETTSLCMALLEKVLSPGMSVLDVGTGSGILALAAALLGAGEVLAIDLDPVAVAVAKENIRRNQLEHVITLKEGDLLRDVDQKAHVVVANIIADAIILLSKAVKDHLLPGGLFIASGIIRDREEDVLAALAGAGFEVVSAEHRGEWVAILARG